MLLVTDVPMLALAADLGSRIPRLQSLRFRVWESN